MTFGKNEQIKIPEERNKKKNGPFINEKDYEKRTKKQIKYKTKRYNDFLLQAKNLLNGNYTQISY